MFGGPAPVSEKRVLGALPDMWSPSSSLPPLSLSTTQQRQPKKNTHTPFLSITQLPFSLLGCVSVMEGDGSVNESMVSKVEMVVEAVGDELELGLGLSLGGVGGKVGKGNYAWGERGRILTAKDFPSSSCVVSSSSNVKSAAAAVSGTKRAADESVPSEGGSPTSVSQVVGWPPIRAYRINSLVNQAKASGAEEDKATDDKDKSKDALKNKTSNGSKMGAASNEKGHLGFVKVNMDGIPIGRKVDLNAHGCYETLAQTLEEMFFPTQAVSLAGSGGEYQAAKAPSKLLDGSSEFVLTYEDKEGDWMLVGDVPWSMFLSSVKRLRIMRTSEANGLAPRFHQRNERQRSKPI